MDDVDQVVLSSPPVAFVCDERGKGWDARDWGVPSNYASQYPSGIPFGVALTYEISSTAMESFIFGTENAELLGRRLIAAAAAVRARQAAAVAV